MPGEETTHSYGYRQNRKTLENYSVNLWKLMEHLWKLQTGMSSTNAFGSLAILVKNKDGSWHLCVD